MVKSAAHVSSPRVAAVLRQLAQSDPEPFVRKAIASPLATPKGTTRRKVGKKAAPKKAGTGATKAKKAKKKRKTDRRDRSP